MNTELNRDEIFANLGSFWYSNLGETAKGQAKSISTLPLYSTLNTQLVNALGNLYGKERFNVKHIIHKFTLPSIVVTDKSPGEDPTPYYPNTTPSEDLFYVIPFTKNIKVLSILSKYEEMVTGVHFYHSNNHLWFRKNPKDLFTNNTIHILFGNSETVSFLNYPLKSYDVSINTSYLSDYYRNEQSPRKFILALAAAMRLPIITETSVLIDRKVFGDRTVYYFDNETITVDYDHTPLEVGKVYFADTLIGDPIKFHTYTTRSPEWYRDLDWSSGLSLDNLTKYKGLLLPDELRTATLVEKDGDNIHVRIDIDYSNQTIFDNYWEDVKRREKETGYYLNNIIGFSPSDAIGSTKQVNPLEVYFEGLLKKKGVVIYLDNSKIGDISSGIEFIKRELYFGIVPIILLETEERILNLLITDDGYYFRSSDNELLEYV